MLIIKNTIVFTIMFILSIKLVFASNLDEITDERTNCHSATASKSIETDQSFAAADLISLRAAHNKVGRQIPFLVIGRTEAEDQAIICAAAGSLLSINLINAYSSLTTAQLGLGFAGSYLAADLASGILHMTLDNIDVNQAPNFLKALAKDFQDHHTYPWRMAHDSFWLQNIELYTGSLLIFTGAIGLSYLGYDFSSYIFASTMAWDMVTQLAHACAHGKFRGNKIISFLQDSGVILSKRHHNKHHAKPFDKNFCILVGYMEPVASRIYSLSKGVVNLWKKFRGTE